MRSSWIWTMRAERDTPAADDGARRQIDVRSFGTGGDGVELAASEVSGVDYRHSGDRDRGLAVVNITDVNAKTHENAVDQLVATAEQRVTTVEAARAEFAGDEADFQPPANATVWRGLEFVLVLRDAPNQSEIEQLISSIVWSPALLTIAGALPLPLPLPTPDAGTDDQPVAVADPPAALPASGSGGLGAPDSDGTPVWWIIASVSLSVVAGLGAVLRGRGRLRSTRTR